MAGGKTNYLKGKIVEHVLRHVAYTSPTNVYVGLFTVAPTNAGGGTECAGTSYARVAATFGAQSGGAVTNSSAVIFVAAGAGDWGANTHFGVFDAVSSGNLLYWAPLDAPVTPANADVVQFDTSSLTITENN